MMELACYVAGQKVSSRKELEIHSPYDRRMVGRVLLAGRQQTEAAIEAGLAGGESLTRFAGASILDRAGSLLAGGGEEFAQLITGEWGLCIRETRYEVGRALDVLRFAAAEALRDDGEIFSGDISPQGKARKIFTTREPLSLAVAITPFNHPLNQVAHKLAPAIAAGTPIILKPSEKTPLTAIRFPDLLYEAGLPGRYLSVLLGPTEEVAGLLVRAARVELVSFTGSVAVGKRIAETAGYKRLVLELGGNDPLIVLDDADVQLAVALHPEGCYPNSGHPSPALTRHFIRSVISPHFTHPSHTLHSLS